MICALFFKQHRLARNAVRVILIDRKREAATVQPGDDFLYGERMTEEFPVGIYLAKWRRRAIEEPDGWTPAPWQRVELLLGGGRAASDSLAGLEVGLAARERPSLPELRPAHPPDRLRLLRLRLLQARADSRSHLPAVQQQVRGRLAVGWTGMDAGQPGRAAATDADLMFGHPGAVDAALDCGRAGPRVEPSSG